MTKQENKVMWTIIIGLVASMAVGGGFYAWFHNTFLTVVGVGLGTVVGLITYHNA